MACNSGPPGSASSEPLGELRKAFCKAKATSEAYDIHPTQKRKSARTKVKVDEPKQLSTGAAAMLLNVSPQTVRNWVRGGKLSATRTSAGRFLVDAVSVDAVLGAEEAGPSGAGTEAGTLEEIRQILGELQSRDLRAARLLEAVERERDRFRAESAAFREAALQLLSAASETDSGVRRLLDVLERQREALIQLLAPGSPEDLTR